VKPPVLLRLRLLLSLLASLLAGLAAAPAGAFPGTLQDWQSRYGALSASGDNAQCQLCHANANGGSPWNAYGWDVLEALADPSCDRNADGAVGNEEAFFCVELVDSDGDGGAADNGTEIGLGTQPGWTLGAFNTLYTRVGTIANQLPPADIGPIDPDGTEPPPPPPPPPPSDEESLPPGQTKRRTIVVRPGQSIQAAIDRAQPGTTIYVLAGVYRELADPTNGLHITKNGIRLVGQSAPGKRVVLENAGNQRNGIVVVPPDRTDCMGCHVSMAPPFELHPDVPRGMKMREPMMQGFEIRGITIRGFQNNGLFTENLDGFSIVDVESVDNRNYGIFPTLSRNGLITHSRAVGSDLDSGIWVETSEDVVVTHNVVEGNVNGFEVSNSDDVLLAHNVARGNTVGMAILLLPDIFDDRPGAKRIDLRDNHIHDNNKANTARPGSILSFVPSGIGILYLGVDDSLVAGNRVENHVFAGIGVADYCVAVLQSPFDCFLGADPTLTPEFLADQAATNNRIADNVLVNNATNPVGDFAFAAADLSLLTAEAQGNCYEGNLFTTFFSLIGLLPACP
jgi:parallel beta-helix repeat protein